VFVAYVVAVAYFSDLSLLILFMIYKCIAVTKFDIRCYVSSIIPFDYSSTSAATSISTFMPGKANAEVPTAVKSGL
jgi:hypothetical protein